MRIKPFLVLAMLASFAVLNLTSCSPIYVLKASYTEARILTSRQDIEESLKSEEIDPSLKEKLSLILSVKKFSETIGLTPRGSYTTYSSLTDLPPTYVITAVESLSLKPVTWWYPFVGSIPYKGYFNKDEALEELENLKKDGYDVSLRESIAYSTLGWFDDPVLQTVLSQDKTGILTTVLHEIMHSTLWIQNHPDFNETMAEATGLMAGLEYAKLNLPDQEEPVKKRILYECEMSFLYEDTYKELQSLFNSGQDVTAIKTQKDEIYGKLLEDIIKARKEILNLETQLIEGNKFNNASFLSSYIYLKELYTFMSVYSNSNRSTLNFVNTMKSLDQSDPYSSLRKLQSSDINSTANPTINICKRIF